MALQTSGIALPKGVAPAIAAKMKDQSTIAALSPAKPEIFADESYLVFNGGSEAEVVAEGASKGAYDQTVSPVVASRLTIQTTTRVSKQLMWADEDNQLEIVERITDDQTGALARALDYIVYHAVSPKTAEAISGQTGLVSMDGVNSVYLGAAMASATKAQMLASIDSMADAVNDGYDVNGVALSKAYANGLRKLRTDGENGRMFPEIPLSLAVGSLEGVPAACSGTVNGRLIEPATGILAIMGNFALIRWGLVRDIRAELIEYGDPDGAGDLKRLNQVAYRTEAVLAYAVLDPAAFAVLHDGVKPA